jgi:dolichol kinase
VPHRDIVIASLWFLALGDAAAALVGRSIGHIRIGDKSLEGSAACFLACWAAGMFFLDSPGGKIPEAAVGAFTAALLEALPMPLDDNLWIPTVAGLVLTALR